ncbi:MAG: hypothetical protein SWY16_27175 [Cyanobacteriota bacterium]|nr:hypothetical protein [Cyanobacteriota bacterium]
MSTISYEVSDYISSLAPDARQIATAVRNHWSIDETPLHHW